VVVGEVVDGVNLAVGGMGMLREGEVGLTVMGDRGVRRGWESGVRWK
jgi:hypothetical protein